MLYHKEPVSLQINLSPSDFRIAKFILPHQLKALANQVDEIILTVESKPSRGRFATGWTENIANLKSLLTDIAETFEVKVIHVDYAEPKKREIAQYFFNSAYIPEKDFRGGPFYAYFYGLYHCKNDLVFHLDADMFLGGNSSKWIAEAASLFNQYSNLLCVAPLPGPPVENEQLKGQHIIKKIDGVPFMYELAGFSTRIFMLKKSLINRYKIKLTRPDLKDQLKAIIRGNPNADLPEHQLSDLMSKHQLTRIDFLGSGTGMWSLHPPYRNQNFYEGLPDLINRIEQNNLPESQNGFYDIVDEVIDWSDVKEKLFK
ncbi:hypothetical protein [Pedobacter soli]|uniref:Glycosyltransferase family 2 protein n=1 Tax=Pedobacter soli TaxID=390242 RepID=A0A1G6X1M3_9SPHI|nr:hypothetical protein [Pedobacter soli]SDD71934.1 hypothetical protein SAMN04488024_107196 [Pedobacter soli]